VSIKKLISLITKKKIKKKLKSLKKKIFKQLPSYLSTKYESTFVNFLMIKELITKKWLYTINHKRLGILYFLYTLVSAIMGSYLATCIRLELAFPGSPFFNGDSLKYLQVITAHALIMIFFVIVPIFFGGFANYFLPYHVGSKDVAYPRLNNMGF
jgi:heme/copper-type cytochrome/quinol oxidase subunit 1